MDFRIFTEPQQGATYEQILRMALVAESAGYDGFFRSDHYLRMGGGSGLPGPTDAWVTLGGLARETQRVRVGTLMTAATFRLPGPLAIAVAEVDAMSGGRVELGIGAGWYAEEHAAYGMPFPDVGERFDRLTEQLAVIRGLWTTPAGEMFNNDGEFYPVSDSPALPKPVQRPHPPIIIGGNGKRRTPALAARYAAEFNMGFQPAADMAPQFDRVRAACEEVGRDPAELTLSAALVTCCGRDGAEVDRRRQRIGQSAQDLAAAGIVGTPAECVDQLGRYVEQGVTRFYFQLLDIDDLDHAELLAAEVVPQLR